MSGYERFVPVAGDAAAQPLLDQLVPKVGLIIPLAALVGAPLCARDRIGATSLNRDAILALTKRVSGDQRMIYPTTNSGYGVGAKDAFCTEETPLNPISLYGTTKVESERSVVDTGRGVTVRLATVFGMAPRIRIGLLVNDF